MVSLMAGSEATRKRRSVPAADWLLRAQHVITILTFLRILHSASELFQDIALTKQTRCEMWLGQWARFKRTPRKETIWSCVSGLLPSFSQLVSPCLDHSFQAARQTVS